MVLKELPDKDKPFVAIVTQSETVDTFQKFKQALRNFDKTENAPSKKPDDIMDSVMKTRNTKGVVRLTCFNCGIAGHKAADCRKSQRERKWCTLCKSSSHPGMSCRKQHNNRDIANKAAESDNHTFLFKFYDEDHYLETNNKDLLVGCGATPILSTMMKALLHSTPTNTILNLQMGREQIILP